jgi:hypothetical protein
MKIASVKITTLMWKENRIDFAECGWWVTPPCAAGFCTNLIIVTKAVTFCCKRVLFNLLHQRLWRLTLTNVCYMHLVRKIVCCCNIVTLWWRSFCIITRWLAEISLVILIGVVDLLRLPHNLFPVWECSERDGAILRFILTHFLWNATTIRINHLVCNLYALKPQ